MTVLDKHDSHSPLLSEGHQDTRSGEDPPVVCCCCINKNEQDGRVHYFSEVVRTSNVRCGWSKHLTVLPQGLISSGSQLIREGLYEYEYGARDG